MLQQDNRHIVSLNNSAPFSVLPQKIKFVLSGIIQFGFIHLFFARIFQKRKMPSLQVAKIKLDLLMFKG